MPPRRTFLESSELAWVEYDPLNFSLTVEFVSGGIYRYDNVSLPEFNALLNAESKGRHFNAYIRENYSYERLS